MQFGTDSCGYSIAAERYIAPANDHPDVKHIGRVRQGRRLGRTYGVKLWPTMIFPWTAPRWRAWCVPPTVRSWTRRWRNWTPEPLPSSGSPGRATAGVFCMRGPLIRPRSIHPCAACLRCAVRSP